mmetsp:Transcript_29076/g.42706  ORF Transcript_29076/g.42706 Transcript_29076/m.42706 type:complete len:84 (+) Transcript_29076:100-351(+)
MNVGALHILRYSDVNARACRDIKRMYSMNGSSAKNFSLSLGNAGMNTLSVLVTKRLFRQNNVARTKIHKEVNVSSLLLFMFRV